MPLPNNLHVIAIDPGVATVGVVVGEVATGRVCFALAIKTYPDGTALRARCQEVIHAIYEAVGPYERQFPTLWAWENFASNSKAKLAADTIYGRGFIDAMLEAICGVTTPHIELTPARVKAFLHPRGKATDKGRTKDLEFRAALNMLDRTLEVSTIPLIADPLLHCREKTWKQGRLHTLDAGAIFAAVRTAFDLNNGRPMVLDPTTHQVKIGAELREHYPEVFEATAWPTASHKPPP